MTYWFTSDEHFNHEKTITTFIFRPFKSVEEMNEIIILKHNERVKEDDIVFHLGDFKMSSQGPTTHELKKRLNGHHFFIKGNHDKNNGNNTPVQYVVIETYGKKVLLIHRPEDAEGILELNPHIDLAFVGHVHNNWKVRNRMINVGVDVWDYYPIHAKQLLKYYHSERKGVAGEYEYL